MLDSIVRANWIERTEKFKLQCLGITLGDAFVQELGMQWVAVEDEHGRDPAVELPGTTIVAFPLTMLSKRIEEGEEVDVRAVFSGICAKVREIDASGTDVRRSE